MCTVNYPSFWNDFVIIDLIFLLFNLLYKMQKRMSIVAYYNTKTEMDPYPTEITNRPFPSICNIWQLYCKVHFTVERYIIFCIFQQLVTNLMCIYRHLFRFVASFLSIDKCSLSVKHRWVLQIKSSIRLKPLLCLICLLCPVESFKFLNKIWCSFF